MKYIYSFIIVLTLCIHNNSFAQNKKIDSLKAQLNKLTAKDTNQMHILIELGRLYSKQDAQVSADYAKKAEILAKELKHEKGEASSLQILGVLADQKANYKEAIGYMSKSLELNRKLKSDKGISACLNNLGIYYFKIGDYTEALKCHTESVVIKEKMGDEDGIISSNINIGTIYDQQKDYKKAKEYYEKALQISEKNEDYIDRKATVLFNLAVIYNEEGDMKKYLEYNQKALDIRIEIQDEMQIPSSYRALGEAYTAMKDYTKAQKYLDDALKMSQKIEDRLTESVAYSSMGDLYHEKNEYQKAIEYHQKGYALAKEIGAKHVMLDAAKDLKENYIKLADYTKANEWGIIFTGHQKEIFSEDKQKEFSRLEGKLDLERKLAKEQREKEVQAEKEAKEQQRKNNLQYSAILIALVSIFLIVVLFARKTMRTSTVENIVFFILLIFFEFILVFLDPFISVYTNGFPIFTLLANVAVAIAFMPIHRMLEKTLKKKLTKEKYEARLGIDIE
ncbi:MAG: tetratricopeptide repeat protein [Raineya sp.]|jgi:tetratricopeptide (TPR) repeat protein|nr:tetratricopeptide repeat protein [Raineya sp.]